MDTNDWREGISSPAEVLKILDGETKEVTFKDEGVLTENIYGKAVVFKVECEGKLLDFYVNVNNFSFLGDIKEKGTLTGKKAKISRSGKTKRDTKYKITMPEENPAS